MLFDLIILSNVYTKTKLTTDKYTCVDKFGKFPSHVGKGITGKKGRTNTSKNILTKGGFNKGRRQKNNYRGHERNL